MTDAPHWTEPGAHRVDDGIHRIPLPLPMDGLRAVNVYTIETEEGLTLVDGGWALDASRKQLDESLASIGRTVSDITRFLVTHAHRDHYTQAVTIRREVGSHVSLGLGDRGTELDERPHRVGPPHARVGLDVLGGLPVGAGPHGLTVVPSKEEGCCISCRSRGRPCRARAARGCAGPRDDRPGRATSGWR